MVQDIFSKKMGWLASTAIILSMSGVAQAQLPGPADLDEVDDEIIVVGQRQAIKDALEIKRNSDSFVDSITATDIGAFPDKSIAEALQRVPGVTVIRTASPTDVTHYSAEPSGVIIRGLTQTRSELNGRDAFSATSGNGLNFEDISPVLLSRVDTFKNQTAEMVEGGIAGTVNLVTRLPFDEPGRQAAISLNANYGDISKTVDPEIAAIYSDRWDSKIGEFGLMFSGTHSELTTTSRGAVRARTMIFEPGTYTDNENYIPTGVFYTDTEYNRTRDGISLAGQWQSNDERFLVTAQYNNMQYKTTWYENMLENYWAFIPQGTPHTLTYTDNGLIIPPDAPGLGFNEGGGGTPFTWQDNGTFGMGTIARSFGSGGWGYGGIDWAADPLQYLDGSTDSLGVFDDGTPLFSPCLNSDVSHGNEPCPYGVNTNTKSRYADEDRSIEDISFNLKWSPTDRLQLNFDYQHVNAETDLYDIVFGFETRADLAVDLTGDLPTLTMLAPSNFNTVGDSIFTNPANYTPNNVMDHITDSEGSLDAFRADAVYEVDNGWIQDVRAGVRFADREQRHNWSTYNFAAVATDWSSGSLFADAFRLDSGATYNDDGTVRFQGYESGYWEQVNFGTDILGGGLLGTNDLLFMNFDTLTDRQALVDRFSINGQLAGGSNAASSWNPICDRPNEVEGSCFTAGEMVNVGEETKSIYLMTRFGGDEANLFGLPVVGNVGVRYVETTVDSTGGTNFSSLFSDGETNCVPLSQDVIDALGDDQYAVSPGCLAAGSAEDQIFSDGGSLVSTVSTKHTNVLPSLNLRLEVADDTFVRFAASKAISKPDIGYLKNFTTINRVPISQTDINTSNSNIVLDGSGNPVSYTYEYIATGSNPRLKPIKADQFDLSIERYFKSVGAFTATLFHKSFDDYIQNGTFLIPTTNNGVTRDVLLTAPVNGEGASISGLELSFERYFDNLPAPFDGFGIQTNYTYVDNSGVENANLTVDTAEGISAVAFSSDPGMINPGRLENLSTHSANVVGIYEKGKFGGRLAYNWRSEYLISVNDCCVGFPVWADAEGFLDGSLRYALTDNLELSLQVSNLTKTRAKTQAQVKGPTSANPDQESFFVPAAVFEYDRRLQFGVRAKF